MTAPYLAAAFAATLLFGVAALFLKIGMSRGFEGLGFRDIARDPWGITKRLARNWIWLLGLAVNGIGGLFYFVALAKLDLTIVKPIITFYVVVAAVLGAFVLKERVSRGELAGIAMAVGGALLLAVQGEAATADTVAIATQVRGMWWVLGGAGGLSVLLCLPLAVPSLERLLPRELSLSVLSGLNWGLGAAWYKLFFNEIEASPLVTDAGGFATVAMDPALWILTAATLSLWVMLGLNVFGFGVYQLALASGRVAVITPIVMVATLIAPVVAGWAVYGEDLPPLKLAGIAVMALGTVVLSVGKDRV